MSLGSRSLCTISNPVSASTSVHSAMPKQRPWLGSRIFSKAL